MKNRPATLEDIDKALLRIWEANEKIKPGSFFVQAGALLDARFENHPEKEPGEWLPKEFSDKIIAGLDDVVSKCEANYKMSCENSVHPECTLNFQAALKCFEPVTDRIKELEKKVGRLKEETGNLKLAGHRWRYKESQNEALEKQNLILKARLKLAGVKDEF